MRAVGSTRGRRTSRPMTSHDDGGRGHDRTRGARYKPSGEGRERREKRSILRLDGDSSDARLPLQITRKLSVDVEAKRMKAAFRWSVGETCFHCSSALYAGFSAVYALLITICRARNNLSKKRRMETVLIAKEQRQIATMKIDFLPP